MSFSSRSYSMGTTQKTLSVYGGAGGSDTRISLPKMNYGPSKSLGFADGLDLHVDYTEKNTLQNLNYRLAAYLEKVHKLEKENHKLDTQIREWYESRTLISHDYSHYFTTIHDLQDKIRAASIANGTILLAIDNAKLAADDFKMKYENELNMKLAVEGDIAGLKRMLDDLKLVKMDLESQYESLKEELIMMRKNHEEELAQLRTQMSGQINVDVQAPSPIDLNQVMKDIREHYESVIAKNRKELDLWYQSKIETVEATITEYTETISTSHTEIKDLKNTLQSLQIELQACLTMKRSLEETLAETKARFSSQLAFHQTTVCTMEGQKAEMDKSMSELNERYGTLLDITTRLENEIREYRRLLEGESESISTTTSTSTKQVVTKVITVKETIVDGKVVESS